MKQSISEFLNEVNIKKIDNINIDNENNMVKIKLIDHAEKPYDLELLGVENYHYIDDYIYVKGNQNKNTKGVSFYDLSPWGYKAITVDRNGNITDESEIEPNLVINSKEKSMCLRIQSAKLDGNFYPVFKNSFFSIDENVETGKKNKC